MRILLILVLVLTGCATMRQTCEYENGKLVSQVTRSTVVGTGETEILSFSCADIGYTTKDTGLSDNATKSLENVAEGAARGAVSSIFPSPSRVLND